MQVKLLKEIVTSVTGPASSKIVDLLYGKKNVNEFLIAKKLKLTINQTRNILYKLSDEGLVSFIRKKDSKKGGWYTYFWTMNVGRSLIKFKERLENEIKNLNAQLETKKNLTFYYCPNCHIEYNEETALLNEYTCPECGEILQLKENSEEVSNLQKEILKQEEVLRAVVQEVEVVMKEEGKVRDRKAKAELKKKAVERADRKKERERLARKEAKKNGTYVAKAKVAKKGKKKK